MKTCLKLVCLLSCLILSIPVGKAQCEIYGDDPNLMEKTFNEVYNQLRHKYAQHDWLLGDIMSDDARAGGAGAYDMIEFQELDMFTHDADNPYLADFWEISYYAINWTNWIIANSDSQGLSTEEAYNYRGKASFLRAYYYFNLVKCFGDVPLLTDFIYSRIPDGSGYEHPFDLDSLLTLDRTPKEDIYSLIVTDLNTAIDLLPAKMDITANDPHWISKGSARALLTKTYIYLENWTEAFNTAEAIISSGEYSLISGRENVTAFGDSTSGFQYVFMHEGENCPESVFEIQCSFDAPSYYGTVSASTQFQLPRELYNEDSSSYMYGWGFNCPTEALSNSFEEGDPRLDFTILDSEDSVLTQNGWKRINFEYSPTNKYNHKVLVHPDHNQGSQYYHDRNLRIIRYSEVLLWAAEAAIHLGQIPKARDYINTVRTRARSCGSTDIPADLTGDVTLTDIYNERRVELAMEGQRFFDLLRWGKASEVLNDLDFIENKNELLPIPNYVLEANSSISQNPGYDNNPVVGEYPLLNYRIDDITLDSGFGSDDTLTFDLWDVFDHSSLAPSEMNYGAHNLKFNENLTAGVFDNRYLKIYTMTGAPINTTVQFVISAHADYLTTTDTILVTSASNSLPTLSENAPEVVALSENSEPWAIILSDIFTDADAQDSLTFVNISNSNPYLLCEDLEEKELVLYIKESTIGVAYITIDARFDGYPISHTFVVRVGMPDQIDEVTGGLEDEVLCFPNPGKGNFTLSNLPVDKAYTLDVLNLSGNIVYNSSMSASPEGIINLNVSHLPQGMYFLQITDGMKKLHKKIIITQ